MNHVRLLFQDQPPQRTEIAQITLPTVAYHGIHQHVQPLFLQGIELRLDERADTSAFLVPAGYEKDFHRMLFQYHSHAAAKPARASNLGW